MKKKEKEIGTEVLHEQTCQNTSSVKSILQCIGQFRSHLTCHFWQQLYISCPMYFLKFIIIPSVAISLKSITYMHRCPPSLYTSTYLYSRYTLVYKIFPFVSTCSTCLLTQTHAYHNHSDQWSQLQVICTVMILSFRTEMPGQTVQTQIEEQSDQGLHCLPFHLHHLDSLLYCRAT